MVLEAKKIHKSFGSKKVLTGVDIKVSRGEIVGLLGPNGSGKSTCFYSMVGLIRPDSGSVILDGEDISKLKLYERARIGIGFLPQETSVFKDLSVEENIMVSMDSNANMYNTEMKISKMNDLLVKFRLTSLKNSLAGELSGGERRRLEIARVLGLEPSFILLDEPLVGIDPIAINEFCSLIRHLSETGIGVLITDHNAACMLKMIDRAYVIHEGNSVINGGPKEIAKNPIVKSTYLGIDF